MGTFQHVKSELFQGGQAELRKPIELISSIATAPVEREFDPNWMKELKHRISTGSAVAFHWAVANLASNGEVISIRMNGQHSSRALRELLADNTLPENLAIHLDTYSVPNEDAAIWLFRQFDARRSARSKQDISGAYQCLQTDLRECNRNILKSAMDGVIWYQRNVQQMPVPSGDDIYRMFNDQRLHPFLLMINEILKNGKSNELKKVPILATVYGTTLQNLRDAEEFWREVSLGTNRNAMDAASDLAGELFRIKDEKESVSARDIYAKCAKAWHAHLEGTRVNNFKVNTKKKGLPSLGDLAD
jgi:hypothetical protein